MQIAAVFPTTQIGTDPGAIRGWAEAVEAMGFDRIIAYDHVVGASHDDREPKLWGPYTEHDPFHEPMVLFGYLAAVTRRVELMTGVLIMPQRQVTLVAKQAAEIDILSGGRLVLGVGTGWNYVEYEALGMDFHNRARRLDEQVELLDQLWSQTLVDFTGRYHRVTRAGLAPLPTRPLPLWFGGSAEPALRRAAQHGQGFSFGTSGTRVVAAAQRLRELVVEAGRDAVAYPIEAILHAGRGLDVVAADAAEWNAIGGSHVAISTMSNAMLGAVNNPCATVDEHLALLQRCRELLP